MMRATLVLAFILILGSACSGFAVPLGPAPGPAGQGNDSPAIASGVASTAPLTTTPPRSIAASGVPAEDPIIKGAGSYTGAPNIPKFPVEMFIKMGASSRFELFFLNVKYDYDLVDFQFYKAWCLRRGAPLPTHTVHTVRLYSSTDPNLPLEYKRMPWRQMNYVINHKQGSKEDVQEAIWQLAKSHGRRKMSVKAVQLVKAANLEGKDFTPAAGDLVAIICDPKRNEQPIFLEYKVPPGKPAVVKSAFFPPAPTVGSFASRLFIPPIFYWPSGGGTPPSPNVPEPSCLLLLATGMVGLFTSRQLGKRFQGRQ